MGGLQATALAPQTPCSLDRVFYAALLTRQPWLPPPRGPNCSVSSRQRSALLLLPANSRCSHLQVGLRRTPRPRPFDEEGLQAHRQAFHGEGHHDAIREPRPGPAAGADGAGDSAARTPVAKLAPEAPGQVEARWLLMDPKLPSVSAASMGASAAVVKVDPARAMRPNQPELRSTCAGEAAVSKKCSAGSMTPALATRCEVPTTDHAAQAQIATRRTSDCKQRQPGPRRTPAETQARWSRQAGPC